MTLFSAKMSYGLQYPVQGPIIVGIQNFHVHALPCGIVMDNTPTVSLLLCKLVIERILGFRYQPVTIEFLYALYYSISFCMFATASLIRTIISFIWDTTARASSLVADE